jgi:hypothetical protein
MPGGLIQNEFHSEFTLQRIKPNTFAGRLSWDTTPY